MSALIAWRNAADDALISATAGTTVVPGAPISNLQKRGLGNTFKATATAPTEPGLTIDNSSNYYGPVDQSFFPSSNNVTYGMVELPDGDILICGAFTSISGTNPQRLARLKVNGFPDMAFNANLSSGANNVVYSVLYDPAAGGRILICGGFTTVQGTARGYVADLTPEGVLQGSNIPTNGVTYAIAKHPTTGMIFVGGMFTTINGQTRNKFGQWRTNPGSTVSIDNTVKAISFDSAGNVLVGGQFGTVAGTARTCIARLNQDGGALLPGFAPTIVGSHAPGGTTIVNAIVVQPDGKILISGSFDTVNGVIRFCVARLNPDGTLDDSFGSSGATNGSVDTMVLLPDGKIMVGGTFTAIYGEARDRIARLNPDGSVDPDFQVTANSTVTALALSTNGVLLGGLFSSLDGIGATRIGRLLSIPARRARVLGLLGFDAGASGGTLRFQLRARATNDWSTILTKTIDSGKRNILLKLPEPVELDRRFRLYWLPADPGLSDHELAFARLYIGEAIDLDRGIDAKWRLGFRDSGKLDASAGQQFFEDVGVRTHTLSLTLSAVPTVVAWGMTDDSEQIITYDNLHALQLEAGTTGEVIFIPRTLTGLWIQNAAVYGHIANPWEIEHQAGPNWYASFAIEEER